MLEQLRALDGSCPPEGYCRPLHASKPERLSWFRISSGLEIEVDTYVEVELHAKTGDKLKSERDGDRLDKRSNIVTRVYDQRWRQRERD